MHPRYRHTVSLLMLLLVLSLSATCFCSSDLPAGSATAIGSSDCGHCPTDAGPHESTDTKPASGHCDSCCHCTCHAPLTAHQLTITCVRHVIPLTFAEPYKALPEVYLSKFIPPQNLA